MMKQCSKCKQYKYANEFYTDKRISDGLRSACKSCYSEHRKTAEYRKRNRDRMRQRRREQTIQCRQIHARQMRNWRRTHVKEYRAKSRIWSAQYRANQENNGGTVTPEEWQALCDYYGNVCLACGKPEVTMDHVIPLNLGGPHSIDNIQPLCKSCNSSKQDTIKDYRPNPVPWRQLSLFD